MLHPLPKNVFSSRLVSTLAITTHPPRCCEDHARLVADIIRDSAPPPGFFWLFAIRELVGVLRRGQGRRDGTRESRCLARADWDDQYSKIILRIQLTSEKERHWPLQRPRGLGHVTSARDWYDRGSALASRLFPRTARRLAGWPPRAGRAPAPPRREKRPLLIQITGYKIAPRG